MPRDDHACWDRPRAPWGFPHFLSLFLPSHRHNKLPLPTEQNVPVTFRCWIFLCKGAGDILSDWYKSNRGPSFLPRRNIKRATRSPMIQAKCVSGRWGVRLLQRGQRDQQPPAGTGGWSSHPPTQRGNVQNPTFLPCRDKPSFFPLSPDLEAQSRNLLIESGH